MRRVELKYRFSDTENSYEVEVYYPEKFHSVCFQLIGQDEMEVLARLYRTHAAKMRHLLKEDT